jgi:DNA-directed RNA polymerase
MLQEALFEIQLKLEQQALDEGREKYLKQQERTEQDQGYGSRKDVSKIIKGCLPLLSASISEYVSKSSNKGKGKTATGVQYLAELDPDLLASLTLSSIFSRLRRKPTITNCLVALGRAIESELWAKALAEFDNKLFNRLVVRATKTHGSHAYRTKAVKTTAAKEGFLIERWADDTRMKVAEPLLNSLLKTLPQVFETYSTYKKFNQTQKWLGLTEEARQYLSEITEAESWMHPSFKPMVIPPRPWTDVNSGGYYSGALAAASSLVRTYDRERLRMVRKAIKSGQMKPCLDALNAIQNTAWAINKPVAEIVQWAWDEGKVLSSFPQKDYLPRPVRPENYESLSPAEQKGWRIKAAQVAERNRGIDGERVTTIQDFAVARQFAEFDQFYIPHTMDFRGRVYALPHFNQQRSDYVKAMLQFSEGKPLGESGAYWLAVHLANCGDFDKLSKKPFDERVAWVEANVETIKEVANDPRGTFEHWSRADSPFCYLAACLDFAGYLREGDSYRSHLAVALDGSNSGLQHYSAALRSDEGKYVNLLPSEAPADIYQAVADLVAEAVAGEAERDDLAALVLRQGINRSLVKRAVMTFAYSSEQFGFKQQLMSDVMTPLNIKVLQGQLEVNPYEVEGDGGFRAAGYLAKQIWLAVNTLVKQAGLGMKFFQKCATALAHEKKGVTWVSPIGLPVFHRYLDFESKTVKLFLFDKAVPVAEACKEDIVQGDDVLKQVRLNVLTKPTGTVNKTKAKSAIAPNVIHSMDASHLLLTVLDAVDADIRSFNLIHDSFGTHAADTEKFFGIIRQAFVNMYQNYCPFEELQATTLESLEDGSRCPDLPQKGTIDLMEVMNSDYAFA